MKIKATINDIISKIPRPDYPYIGKWTFGDTYIYTLFTENDTGVILATNSSQRKIGEVDINFSENEFVPFYGSITIQGDLT